MSKFNKLMLWLFGKSILFSFNYEIPKIKNAVYELVKTW